MHRFAVLLVLAAVSCRTDQESKVLEALGEAGEPALIAPAPNADEETVACEASRLWKYADLSYKSADEAAATLKGDQSFPGAVVLGRFAAKGDAGEVVPTYLVRDETSCNLLISMRGTAGRDDAATDANFIGGRSDGLLAKLAPGVAHRGFANATVGISSYEGLLQNKVDGETLFEKLDEAVAACRSPRGARILVTGHSLGGAVASLVHFILLETKNYDSRLVTFGSPRPISSGALDAYAKAQAKRPRWGKDLRVAGTNDSVTYVPPASGGFRHLPGTLLSVYRGGHTGATYGYAESTRYLCDNDVAQKKAQRGEGSPLVNPGCLNVVLPPNTRGALGPCSDAVDRHQSGWYQVVSTSLSRYWTCKEMLAAKREASDNPLWRTEWDKCRGKLVRCMSYVNETCPFPTGTAVDGRKACAMRGDSVTDLKACAGSPCAGNPPPAPAADYLNGTLWTERREQLVCQGGRLELRLP